MKRKLKLLLVVLPFFLTGCFGGAGKGNLSNTCVHNETSNELNQISTYYIDFKEGIISNIKLVNDYDKDIVLDTLNSEEKIYGNMYGVTINIDKSNYQITYNFDMTKISKDVKEHFSLSDNYNEQIKKLTSMGYSCK